MALTNIKDVDLKILSELDDRELFAICNSKDIYIHRICKDENFWRNRLLRKYGQKSLELKPEGRRYKKHYLQMTIDLDKFSKNPKGFLLYILWSPKGTEYSRFAEDFSNFSFLDIDTYGVPFSEAPEWAITNYYFLKIPKFFYQGQVYPPLTPQQIFEILRPLARTLDNFISGEGVYHNYLLRA